MLVAIEQRLENSSSSSLCNLETPISQSINRQTTIAINDVPDQIIHRILDFYMRTPRQNVGQLRLVNKRLAELSLCYTMRTIIISSPEQFVQLCSSGHGPLLNQRLGKHVHCFELRFMSRIPEVVEINDRIALAFPNLKVVRFKFSTGVLIYAGDSLQTLLTEDTLFRSYAVNSDSSLHRFLARLHPQRFEWISPEKHDIYLVGMYRKLRYIFRSWKTLSSVYLEGICLVEQQHLGTWNFALFADKVHIKGSFSSTEPVLLQGLRRMKDSNKCRHLVFEETWPTDQCYQEMCKEEVSVLTYGNTMVSLKHWSALNRQRLKACATGRTVPPCVSRYSPRKTNYVCNDAPPITRPLMELVLLVALCALLCILHLISPQHSLLGQMHLSLFDVFGGPYRFDLKSIYWIICRDGSYLGKKFCASDSSLWFPDRSLMYHPT